MNSTLKNEPVNQNMCSFALSEYLIEGSISLIWQALILCNQLIPITMEKVVLNVECI